MNPSEQIVMEATEDFRNTVVVAAKGFYDRWKEKVRLIDEDEVSDDMINNYDDLFDEMDDYLNFIER